MEQRAHLPIKNVSSAHETKLHIQGIAHARKTGVISRRSLGIETPLVKVCPRLRDVGQWRLGSRQSPQIEPAVVTFHNDTDVEVRDTITRLPAEHIVVLNELLDADKPLPVSHFMDCLGLPHITRDVTRIYARGVLRDLVTILGEDVIAKQSSAQTTYQIGEMVILHDMRVADQ